MTVTMTTIVMMIIMLTMTMIVKIIIMMMMMKLIEITVIFNLKITTWELKTLYYNLIWMIK